MQSYLPQILFTIAMLILSAFFSASETALFSIPREQIPSFENSPDYLLRRIYKLLQRGQKTLMVILVGNLAVNIITVGMVNGLMCKFIPNGGVMLTLFVATGLILVFGEVLPKNIAIGHGLLIARFTALPLYYFGKIISPIILILQSINHFFLSLFSRYLRSPSPFITEKELVDELEKSTKDGIVSAKELSLLKKVLPAGHRTVSTVAIHRSELLYVNSDETILTVAEKMREHEFWFCAVSKNSGETNIAGFIFLEDIEHFLPKKDRKLFHEMSIAIPSTMELADVVITMQQQGQRVASVQDEFGISIGAVTLKMAMNSILPPFNDNQSKETITTNRVVFSGKEELIDMEDWIPKSLLGNAKRFRTLNGLITGYLGRIPIAGEQFAIDEFMFYIIDANERVIGSIRVERRR